MQWQHLTYEKWLELSWFAVDFGVDDFAIFTNVVRHIDVVKNVHFDLIAWMRDETEINECKNASAHNERNLHLPQN